MCCFFGVNCQLITNVFIANVMWFMWRDVFTRGPDAHSLQDVPIYLPGYGPCNFDFMER